MSTGMIDSPQSSIGKLMRDNVFHVPRYQRDYRWTVEKVTQLFDDLDAAVARRDERYFLGLMVFMRQGDQGELVVLDGQQRLATIFVFLAACRNWMNLYGDLRKDAAKIDAEVMGERRYGEDAISPRIVLNSANNQAFDSFVVQSRPVTEIQAELSRMKKHDRSRRILEAAVYCHDRIAKLAEETDHKKAHKHLTKFMNYLNERAPVVNLTVPDEGSAFTIFETLNDRGMELSPLDLIKNHLFRCLGKNAIKERDLESRWGQMMSNLEESAPDQFLKAFWTSQHGRTQAHTLFRDFTRNCVTMTDSQNVSVDMLTASERYAAMSNADDPIWAANTDEGREVVRSLNILGAQQAYPVILAAFERFPPQEMERLLRLFEVLIVRYQFVGGGRTGALEIECAKLAHAIHDKRLLDTGAVFREMKSVYPNDGSFKASLREMRKAAAAKTIYLLKGLDREAQRQATNRPVAGSQFDADLTIEHVLPQNPGSDWPEEMAKDEDNIASWLGNLCLLKRGANKNLGRSGYPKKKVVYADSQVFLTKGIAEYRTWDRAAIIKRQNYLAELGVQAWRFQ